MAGETARSRRPHLLDFPPRHVTCVLHIRHDPEEKDVDPQATRDHAPSVLGTITTQGRGPETQMPRTHRVPAQARPGGHTQHQRPLISLLDLPEERAGPKKVTQGCLLLRQHRGHRRGSHPSGERHRGRVEAEPHSQRGGAISLELFMLRNPNKHSRQQPLQDGRGPQRASPPAAGSAAGSATAPFKQG